MPATVGGMKPRTYVLVGLAVAVLGVVALSRCDSRPGDAGVYQRIEAEFSCADLQREFDTASASHDRDSARGRADLAEIATSYMRAVDARMRELGC